MRSYQIFAAMTPEQAQRFFELLVEKVPLMFSQAVHVASAAFKTRPAYLLKQPFEKQAATVRRALARVGGNQMADEALAVYFLECKRDLLTEWLDLIGLAHENGALEDDEPAQPDEASLREQFEAYRSKDDDSDRDLLLRAFAAQDSIEWPVLDELIAAAS